MVVKAGLLIAGAVLVIIAGLLFIPSRFQIQLFLQGVQAEVVLRLPGGWRKKIIINLPSRTAGPEGDGNRGNELNIMHRLSRQLWTTVYPRVSIKELHVSCTLGLVNHPDLTGWLYALYCAGHQTIKQLVSSWTGLTGCRFTFSLYPVFTVNCFTLQASCIFKASLANIIRTGWQWRKTTASIRQTTGRRG
ncbi:MAG: hypothetical protein ACUVTU_01380 [Desulfurispora sp.]|uniref:hypothetical protein n=1 Tax=Desulfurispora sp. TaxID=3014275 RepID=UPI00404AB25C